MLDFDLASAADSEILKRAESEGLILISKDEDFLHLALRPGTRVVLIWVRVGNCRKQHLLDTFERVWSRMVERVEAGERVIEVR